VIDVHTSFVPRRRRWQEAAIADPVDLIGLLACLTIASLLRPLPATEGERIFMLLLVVVGGYVRLLEGRARSLETILGKPRRRLLRVPFMTVLIVILVQSLSRSYYSGYFAVAFAVLWAAWILASQLLLKRLRGPLRVMLIEPAPFMPQLASLSGLQVTARRTPPARFDDWDLVVLDSARQYSTDWYVWLSYADMFGLRAVAAPLVIEGLAGRMPLNMLFGEWPHEIFHTRANYVSAKRVIDTVLVVLSLPLTLPLVSALYLAVLIADGRPALFWQWRDGLHGKPFRMLKLRTMRVQREASAPSFTGHDDVRVTRLGRLLRRTRLDELPQLWNVLRGEMSLIGPRPEQTEFVRQFRGEIPMFDLRHNVRPGITGWAQVQQGYAANVDDSRQKLCFDLYYVRRCSPQLDLYIAVKTVLILLTGFGSR